MAIVILLAVAAYALVVAETGGEPFKIWRPDRMRLVLIALIVVGAAAYEFRPSDGALKSRDVENERPETHADDPVPSPGKGEGCASESGDVPAEDESPVAADRVQSPSAPKIVSAVQKKTLAEPHRREESALEAEGIWNRAREMPHGFVPDEVEDLEYLKLVREAARLGHAPAMAKLGDYAFRRGWIVEAYYWTLLAQMKGAAGLDGALAEIRKVWAREGCPPEYENVRPDFSETQGMFARAVLRLRCGRDAALARRRLRELRDANCPEALLYLSKTDGSRV